MIFRRSRLIPLDDNIFLLRGSIGSNIYLIANHQLSLVDAGFPLDYRIILQGLREMGTRPDDLRLVIATHYHGDHVGSISFLQQNWGTKAAIHALDAPYARGEIPYERFKCRTSRIIFYRSLWPLFKYRYFQVHLPLKDGDIVEVSDGLEVIHTPGHSVGSICLYNRSKGILFSGDLIRNESGLLEGPPTEFTPDPSAAADSLRKIADLDFRVLLPGHGDPILEKAGERFKSKYRSGKIWPANHEFQYARDKQQIDQL
jgi:glyoxylase-like metal-dependent hydrolase (beta-lactamase superfamily II)